MAETIVQRTSYQGVSITIARVVDDCGVDSYIWELPGPGTMTIRKRPGVYFRPWTALRNARWYVRWFPNNCREITAIPQNRA